MRSRDGRLLHSYKDGQAKFNGYLDDYAYLIDGLTRLYEATGEPRWIEAALDLARVMIDEFADRDGGGFFYTGTSHEALIARQKDAYDNATPSGNAMAATALLAAGGLDRPRRPDASRAGRRSRSVQAVIEKAPTAAGQSLIALDFLLATPREFAVVAGPDPDEFRAVLEAIHCAVPAPQGRGPGTRGSGGRPRPSRPPAGRPPGARRAHDDLHLRALRLPGAGRRRRGGELPGARGRGGGIVTGPAGCGPSRTFNENLPPGPDGRRGKLGNDHRNWVETQLDCMGVAGWVEPA